MAIQRDKNAGGSASGSRGEARVQHSDKSAPLPVRQSSGSHDDDAVSTRDTRAPRRQSGHPHEPAGTRAANRDVPDLKRSHLSTNLQASLGRPPSLPPGISTQKSRDVSRTENKPAIGGKPPPFIRGRSASPGRSTGHATQQTGKPKATAQQGFAGQKTNQSPEAGKSRLCGAGSSRELTAKSSPSSPVARANSPRGRSGQRPQATHPTSSRPGAQARGASAQQGPSSPAQAKTTPSPVDLHSGQQFMPDREEDGTIPMPEADDCKPRGPGFKMGVGIETEFFLKCRSKSQRIPTVFEFANNLAKKLNEFLPASHPGVVAYNEESATVILSKWNITLDGSMLTDVEPWGLEMITPILVAFPGSTWRQIVSDTWSILTRHYEVTGGEDCSTHIHVSVEEGYSLDEAKRVVGSAIHFESALDKLVPAARRSPRCRFAKALGTASNSLGVARRRTPRDELVEGIARCDSFAALVELVNPGVTGTYFSFNLHSMLEYYTIEFRKPPHSVSADEALGWAELAIAFVRSAIKFGGPDQLDATGAGVGGLREFLLRSAEPGLNEPGRLESLFTKPDLPAQRGGGARWTR